MDGLRQRLRDLAVDRTRTVLVILGVVWGALSLTVVLSFGSGLDLAMGRAMRATGRDLILLWGGTTSRPHAGLPAGRWIGLEAEDALHIRERVPGVGEVSVEFIAGGVGVEGGGRRANAQVHGVSSCYGDLRYFPPEPGGRFLDERDEADRRRVAFLGDAVKERLFGDRPATGKKISIWGAPFTVVGVLRPKLALGNYEFLDSEKILIPAGTFRALTGWRYVSYVVVGVTTPEANERIVDRLYRALGPLRGFDPEDRAALGVLDWIAQHREVRRLLAGIRILLAIVGILGLLAAVVGVANVVYVLVEERRREIGIQMALGARARSLFAGVIFDALVLTFAGGVAGIAGSAVVLWSFNRLPLDESARGFIGEPALSFIVAAGVTLVLGVAGSFAGYVPARRAARVDPVEALRAE
ncbi:MAG: ABC transporter permease [Planctomycetes bacterium]|nr:ABC transporter permease [Planctomycetota bacterium]